MNYVIMTYFYYTTTNFFSLIKVSAFLLPFHMELETRKREKYIKVVLKNK